MPDQEPRAKDPTASDDSLPASPRPPLAASGGAGAVGRKAAVALRYQDGKNRAPEIAASGRGMVADRIVELAAEHGIPIREDPDLVQLLMKLDLGEEIPAQLYPIIAEVFAFVYRLNAERRKT